MEKDNLKGQGSFRYTLVMYIILLILVIPGLFFLVPRAKQNLANYHIREHYEMWRASKDDSNIAYYPVILFSDGKEVNVERKITNASTPIHSLLEALISPLNKTEKNNMLSTFIPEGTKLIGASYDGGFFFVELSKEFLSSKDIDKALEQIKKTLNLYYKVESLTVISDETIFKI